MDCLNGASQALGIPAVLLGHHLGDGPVLLGVVLHVLRQHTYHLLQPRIASRHVVLPWVMNSFDRARPMATRSAAPSLTLAGLLVDVVVRVRRARHSQSSVALSPVAAPRADARFKLRENPKHLEQGPAGGSAGIDGLLMQVEIDLFGLQFSEEADQVLQRAAKAIHGPGCHHVKFASDAPGVQLIEAGAQERSAGGGR